MVTLKSYAPTKQFDCFQFHTFGDYSNFVDKYLLPLIKERKRTLLDKIFLRPICLDKNWYIETENGKVWLSDGDWIAIHPILGQFKLGKYTFEDNFVKVPEFIK